MQQRYNAPHSPLQDYYPLLHQYITIHHLVVTKPITFHSLNTFHPTYLNIPGYRSTSLLIHSTPYLSLYYSFSLSPALDSVNMYFPSFAFIYDTLGKHVSTRWPINTRAYPLALAHGVFRRHEIIQISLHPHSLGRRNRRSSKLQTCHHLGQLNGPLHDPPGPETNSH